MKSKVDSSALAQYKKSIERGFVFLFMMTCSFIWGQTSSTITAAGAGTYNVPTGVTAITVECWGAGGGGGNSAATTNNGGGGGGGGAYAKKVITGLTAGQNISYSVGLGGAGAVVSPSVTIASDGGDTWFQSSSVLKAVGGTKGVNNINGSGSGGAGGSSGACIGDLTYSGGAGANATNSLGGGGGSSAGTGSDGNPGSGIAGGAAVIGGGAGGSTSNNSNGSNGLIPGGGGGGSDDGTTRTGGNGANGQIVITPLNPNVSNFSATAATALVGDGSVVTVNSASLSSRTYTVTYSVSGTNTVASTTATMIFSGGTGTFYTAELSVAGNANVVNITAITGDGYTTALSFSTAAFTTTATTTCTSIASSNWNVSNTWNCGGVNRVPTTSDDVVIASGFSVTLVNNQSVHDLFLQGNGSLTDNNGTPQLTVSGDFTLNGTISASTTTISLTGINKIIDGLGNVTAVNGSIIVTNNKTIASSANLFLSSGISITAGSTITNQGQITVGGNITGTGTSSSSIWINDTNSTLNLGGTGSPPIFTASGNQGVLYASAIGNTVHYYGSPASSPVSIPLPHNNTYYNLEFSGTSGTRSVPSSTTIEVENDFTINTSSAGVVSTGTSGTLKVGGDWTNNATFATAFTQTSTGTVIFDGTGDQTLTALYVGTGGAAGAAGENFASLTIANTGGTVTFNSDVTVEGTLTMTSGNVMVASSKTFTLGLNASNPGTLNRSSGTVLGKFKRFISSPAPVGAVLYPVGTGSFYRPLNLTLSSVTTAGFITAEFVSDFPGNTNLPQVDGSVTSYNTFRDGYWTLQSATSLPVGGTTTLALGGTFDLSLTGTGFSGFPTIDNNTRLLTRKPTNWVFDGSHVTYVSNNIVSRTGMASSGISTTAYGFAFGDDTPCPTTYPILSISGDNNICASEPNREYTIASPTSTSTYTWDVFGDVGFVNSGTLPSPVSSAITVDWNTDSPTAGYVAVYETDVNGCSGNTYTYPVNVQSIPPGSVTGGTDVPQNNVTLGSADQRPLQTYTTTAQSYYTAYTWVVTGGKIVSGGTEYSSITNTVGVRTTEVGTLSASAASTAVTGSGTLFTGFRVGQVLYTSGNVVIGTIASIASNTALTLTGNASGNYTNISGFQTGGMENTIAVRWDAAGTGTVKVRGTTECDDSDYSAELSVNIYNLIFTTASGSWNSATSFWSCNCVPTSLDNVLISSGHIISITNGSGVSVKNLIVAGTLSGSSAARSISVSGDLTMISSGILGNGAAGVVNLISGSTTNQKIDGTGTINPSGAINIQSNRSIAATANITTGTGAINLSAGVEVTNNGIVTAGAGGITGTDGTSIWTNAAGSTLNIAGPLLATGTLNASASGNTVNYNGTGAQTVKVPSSSQYRNISFNNSTATGLATPAVSSTINVSGTWMNNATTAVSGYFGFNPNSGKVIFNGASDQTITGPTPSTFYDVDLSGSSTVKTFSTPVVLLNNLEINSGVVANLGTSTAHAARTLTLAGASQTTGTWGSSASLAANQNDTFFSSSGLITIGCAGAPSSNPTVCPNVAMASITIGTPGATGIGVATGLPTGVTAIWASNVITISGTPTLAGVYNYSIPLTGGGICTGANATGTITVTTNSAGVASSTPTLCINTALANITHTTVLATGIGSPTGLPAGVTAAWSSNTITISGTPTVAGTFNYSIPLTGGCGTANATGTITVNNIPTTANAGLDQTDINTCGLSSVTLAGNSPAVGTGAWSIISGTGGIITTPSSNTSTFNGTAGSTYTLRWTISNSPCTASTDDVVITFNQNPTTANAGTDQTDINTCGLTSVTLAGNSPSVGTGAWSIISGTGGTITTTSSNTSIFNGTAGSTYALRWTISNSPCTASTDDVVITFNQNPTTANAGIDQTGIGTCGLTSVTLAGNSPSVGTGTWSIVSGTGGLITTPSSNTSTFSGTTGSTYILRWTISNSPCTASTDDVVITFNENPTTANAGLDQTDINTCGLSSVTLAGNSPSVGTGAWSIISGTGGTVTTPTSNTSTFNGTAGSTYTLRWTISNSPCMASTDDMVITFNQNPTIANAGPDQTDLNTCGLTSVSLAGNLPAVGTGSWSIISGTGGTITTPSNNTSTFSGTAGSTYTLRWTIGNSPCTASTDDVVIIFNQNATVASNSSSQTICNTGSTSLSGNSPSIGTGAWSIVSGPNTNISQFSSTSNSTATFTPAGGVGAYILRWTISNSPCTASTADATITVTNTNQWNGTTANWFTPSNWSCGFVPGLLNDVVIPSGSTSYPIVTAPVTINSLAIAPFGSITMNSGTQLTLTGDLTINGTFTDNGSTLIFNGGTQTITGANASTTDFNSITTSGSFTAPATLNLTGDLTNSGTFTSGSTVILKGTGPQSLSMNSSPLNNSLNDVIINKSGGTVSLGTNLVVAGGLTLTAGNLDFTNRQLTLNGTFTSTGSGPYLVSSNTQTTSHLEIGGTSGGSVGNLYFLSSANTISTFTLNRTGALASATIANNLNIASAGNLFLTSGILYNSVNMPALGIGATITRTADGILNTAFNSGSYNVSYLDGSTPGTYLTANEIVDGLVNNIHVNNTTGSVTLDKIFNLTGVMTFGNNGSFDAGNEQLTVKSTSVSQGGIIGEIKGGTFSGTINVERFMDAIGQNNHYISSPVTNAQISDIHDDFPLQRNVARLYNEPVNGGQNSGYSNVGLTHTMQYGRGYLVFPTAAEGAQPSHRWKVKGPLDLTKNQGDVKLPISFTAANLPSDANGWNLVGNPYPAPIVWDLTAPDKWSSDAAGTTPTSNISNTFYITDVQSNGSVIYRPFTNGDYIAPGQAFWVKADAVADIYVHEAAKSNTNTVFYRKANNPDNWTGVDISLSINDITDRASVRINPNASLGFDQALDAYKLEGDMMSLGTASTEGYNLVWGFTNQVGENTIELVVKALYSGEYKLNFESKGNWSEFNNLYLVDKEQMFAHKLSMGAYTFYSDGTLRTRDRFYLTSRPENLIGDIAISVFPNPMQQKLEVRVLSKESTSATILDMNGVVVAQGALTNVNDIMHQGTFDVQHLSPGVYLIKTIIDGKVIVKKVIKL